MKLGAVGVGKERGGEKKRRETMDEKKAAQLFMKTLIYFCYGYGASVAFYSFFFLMSFYVSFFKWEKLETGLHHDIHTLMYCTGSQGRKALLFSLRDWRTEMNYPFFAFFLGWLGLVRESFIYE